MERRLQLVLAVLLLSSLATQASEVFYDSFDDSWEGRWITSSKSEYQGKWKHEYSKGHADFGLLASEKARKYGVAVNLKEKVTLGDETLVLQYDLRLQNGLECGGAYLKFLVPQEAGWSPSQFDNETPYSIMFGPDRCGATNKVHFIFRHTNPTTGAVVEHHLRSPPTPINDKLTHVYTAVIYGNDSVSILVDGVVKKTASLLSAEFEPPVVPASTIPDPEDRKPEEWDERAKIPDPEATKPDDWDESAPREIEDLDAVKPEGWLDDEPDEIDDAEAEKPEDWDDEEDGEWEAPKVPNPKCEAAPGCGVWKVPTKKNPAYKGKWSAPLIDNPAYQGIWKPRQIPNPDYFELDKPELSPLGAIGIEIWTMQDGILFDNVLITRDEEVAKKYRDEKWKPKFDVEKLSEEEDEKEDDEDKKSLFDLDVVKSKLFEQLHKVAEVPQLAPYRTHLKDLIKKGEENSTLTLVIFGSLPIVLLLIILRILFGGKSASAVPVAKSKKEDITSEDDAAKPESTEGTVETEEASGEIEKEGEEVSGALKRRPRRET